MKKERYFLFVGYEDDFWKTVLKNRLFSENGYNLLPTAFDLSKIALVAYKGLFFEGDELEKFLYNIDEKSEYYDDWVKGFSVMRIIPGLDLEYIEFNSRDIIFI